jgi:H+-transporting ATPase
MTGHAVLTPTLMVLLMCTGDFLAMSAATDNVRPSPTPNVWRIYNLTIAGMIMACCNLVFCCSVLAFGKFYLRFATAELQTLAAMVLVFSGQSVMYVVREREHLWSSPASNWLIASSVADVTIIASLAMAGIVMTALPALVVLAGAAAFAFVLDIVKVSIFVRLRMV